MLLASLAVAAVLTQAAPAPPPKANIRIIVLDLKPSGVPDAVAEAVSSLLPAEVRKVIPSARITSGAEVQALLGLERQKALAGCASDSASCMAEVVEAL